MKNDYKGVSEMMNPLRRNSWSYLEHIEFLEKFAEENGKDQLFANTLNNLDICIEDFDEIMETVKKVLARQAERKIEDKVYKVMKRFIEAADALMDLKSVKETDLVREAAKSCTLWRIEGGFFIPIEEGQK
jgi:predicted nuclease with TOPRIM domain